MAAEPNARRRIITAVTDLLLVESPESITLRGIAEQASVALSTVQYYFPNKDELLESALDAYYARLDLLLSSFLHFEGSMKELVDDVVERFFAFAQHERQALQLRTWLSTRAGRLPHRREQDIRAPVLELTSLALAQRIPTLDMAAARLAVQSMTFLVTRYAQLSAEELVAITGASSPSAGLRAIRHHLQCTAAMLLGLAAKEESAL